MTEMLREKAPILTVKLHTCPNKKYIDWPQRDPNRMWQIRFRLRSKDGKCQLPIDRLYPTDNFYMM